jgi:hypothetical protein
MNSSKEAVISGGYCLQGTKPVLRTKVPFLSTLGLLYYLEDGGRRFRRNVGNDLQGCTALHL